MEKHSLPARNVRREAEVNASVPDVIPRKEELELKLHVERTYTNGLEPENKHKLEEE